MARKYRLTFTEDHLHALLMATEFHERIAMGQFREVLEVVDPGFKLPHENREMAEQMLTIARRYLMPALATDNSYWGIRSREVRDENRVMYDILQVVRHRLAWDRHPEGGMTINFDRPWRSSEKLDLIEIELLPDQESSEASLAQSGSRSTTSAAAPVKSGSKSGRGSRKVGPRREK